MLKSSIWNWKRKKKERRRNTPWPREVQPQADKLSWGSEESDHKWLKSSFVCHYVHYVVACPIFFLSSHCDSGLGLRLSRWKGMDSTSSSTSTLCPSASLIGHIQNQQAEKQSVTSLYSSKHPHGLTHAQCTCVIVSLFLCWSSIT